MLKNISYWCISLLLMTFSLVATAQRSDLFQKNRGLNCFENINSYLERNRPEFSLDYFSNLETLFGVDGADKALRISYDFMEEFYATFTPHEKRGLEEAKDFIHTFDSLLNKNDLVARNSLYLNESLSTDQGIACFHKSLIAVELSKEYAFYIKPFVVDYHIAVKYEAPNLDTSYNLEVNEGKLRSNEFYQKILSIDDEMVENGSYLRSLNDEESIALLLRTFALKHTHFDQYDEAIPYLKKSYTMDSLGYTQLYELVDAYARVDADSALHYYKKLKKLNSKDDENNFLKGFIYYTAEQFDSAQYYFGKSIDINESHSKSMYYSGKIFLERENYDALQEQITNLFFYGDSDYAVKLNQKYLNISGKK